MIERLNLAAVARLDALAVPEQIAVQRLHRRVGDVREGVFGLDHLVGLVEHLVRLAVALRHHAGFLRDLAEFGVDLLGVAPFGLRIVPRHLQPLPPLDRRPGIFGVNRHAGGDLLHRYHPRHRQRAFGVEGRHLTAETRRFLDGDGQHVRLMDILRELRAAVGFRQPIDAMQAARFADQGEISRILQRQAGGIGRRQRGGQRGEFAEARFASAGGMANPARLHGDFLRRGFPALRGGLHQQRTRHGAHAAHLLIGFGHRAGTAGALESEAQVFVDMGVHRRGDDPHLRPVGIELFGNQRRHAGIDPLAHFGVFTDDGDDAVGADLNEGVGIKRCRAGGGRGIRPRQRAGGRQIGADHQRPGADDKPPPRKRNLGYAHCS